MANVIFKGEKGKKPKDQKVLVVDTIMLLNDLADEIEKEAGLGNTIRDSSLYNLSQAYRRVANKYVT